MAQAHSGLPEVDYRFNGGQEKFADPNSGEQKIPVPVWTRPWQSPPGSYGQDDPKGPSYTGRRRSALPMFLSVALALAVVALAVVAGVVGSLAATRQNKLESCQASQTVLPAADSRPAACSSSSTSSTSSSPSPSATGFAPSSECSTLFAASSVYPASTDGALFSLKCKTDLRTVAVGEKDLMGVYVYTFRDCISACASYNQFFDTNGYSSNATCYAVSLNLALSEDEGNCWLKAYNHTTPTTDTKMVDSAILIQEPSN